MVDGDGLSNEGSRLSKDMYFICVQLPTITTGEGAIEARPKADSLFW